MNRRYNKYKPKTSEEYNVFHIESRLEDVRLGRKLPVDCAQELNKRFVRLKGQNLGIYEDLYPKYIKIFRDANKK